MIKYFHILAKCSDCCSTTIENNDGTLREFQGYVPGQCNIGGGDYIEFTVDNETGKIVNWKPITEEIVENINV